jgi:hypothetical protein
MVIKINDSSHVEKNVSDDALRQKTAAWKRLAKIGQRDALQARLLEILPKPLPS